MSSVTTPSPVLPGWSSSELERLASEVLDREGRLVFRSEKLARLTASLPYAMGTPRRPLQPRLDAALQPAIESWLAFIVSGALARLRIRSGTIDLPRMTGGTTPCRWRYFPIPEGNPDYHVLVFSPLENGRRKKKPAREFSSSMLDLLTTREREVLGQLFDGYSAEEIGQQLALSIHTVRTHVRSIYAKLHVNSRPKLMAALARDPASIATLEKVKAVHS
jgi:DNA-binding CsgD family transcriptional regulator